MSHLSIELEEIDHEIRYLQHLWDSTNPYWKDNVKEKFERHYWSEYIKELEKLRYVVSEMDRILDRNENAEE